MTTEQSGYFATLFAELRRRRVFRVVAAYSVAAWIVIQVCATVFPLLRFPQWAATLVVLIAFIGLIVATALAWAFDVTPEGIERTTPVHPPAPGRRMGRRALRIGVLAILIVAAASLGAWTLRVRRVADSLDLNAVAVLPFRVSADPSLSSLGEGMVDLLAAKLTGEGGLRAIDPRVSLSAWKRFASDSAEARDEAPWDVASRVGAGYLLQGSVVGASQTLVIAATLYSVPLRRKIAQTEVRGPADSLPALVDRLAAELLTLRAGEGEDRLAALTSTSLPALRAYLDGKSAYRRGDFHVAADHFAAAIKRDTTFALAGLGLTLARLWATNPPQLALGQRIAWQGRERLSARDRAFVEALNGPRFPDFTAPREGITAWEKVVEQSPGDPEAWYHFADRLFHDGAIVGYPQAEDRAMRGFQRSLALDSTFVPPIIHLIELRLDAGDTSAVRQLVEFDRRHNRPEQHDDDFRLFSALAVRDTAALRVERARLQEAPSGDLRQMGAQIISTGLPTGILDTIEYILENRPNPSRQQRLVDLGWLYAMHLNRGHTSKALATAERMREENPAGVSHLTMKSALSGFWQADDTAGNRVLEQMEPLVLAQQDAPNFNAPEGLCIFSLQHGLRNNAVKAHLGIRALERLAPPPAAGAPPSLGMCERGTLAALAVVQRRPDASRLIAALDSSLLQGEAPKVALHAMNLLSSMLHERVGEQRKALAAARRRDFYVTSLFAQLHLQEARLAAQLGERSAAIHAYRKYLNVRSDPEPGPLRDETEQAKKELARLVAGG